MFLLKTGESRDILDINTAQNIKFSIKDFFSNCDQIRSFMRNWSYLLKEILYGKLHFLCSVRDRFF